MPPSPESASSLEESQLLARVGAAERDAFRDLYGRYGSALFSLALRLVGERGAAEEILQDTFLKIWTHAAAYDARLSRPFTWAVTILRRTAIDHLRKHRRHPAATPLPEGDAVPAPFATPELARATAEAHESADRVHAALAQLSSPQRDALELALFSTLTHAEIAARLGQPAGTVKSWIRRGLLDLRSTLNHSAA